MKITVEDIGHIALGGAFLATGGGGDTLVGEIIAEEAIKKHGPVELVPLDQLADDATVVAIGGVGAPTIMQEKTSNGDEPGWALDMLESYIGKRADALIAFEAGGLNALVPFVAAAARGLPVVDADGMGRAFPELQMESFSIYGVSATPLSAAGELGDSLIIKTRNSTIAERLVRHFAVAAGGGQCTSAEHVMDGATAKRVSVKGTIGYCLEIGRLLERRRGKLDLFLADLADFFAPTHYGAVKKLYEGKIADVTRQVIGGYDVGALRVTAFEKGVADLDIQFKNEYLIALKGDEPLAMTPDLICILDNETSRPITAETIRYGQRVTVIGVGAPAIMRTERALEVVAPRNFGFDRDYVAIEDL
ncbi:MAG: DUF917 domain-containing protein [Parvularculaceae bacterium]